MIKKILPFEKLVYRSTLPKDELLVHLQNEIEAEKPFSFRANKFIYSKPYIGKIYNDSFEIKRAINYRNSFLPQIKGEIKDDLNGSKITVKMNLIEIVKVFMIIWLSGVLVGCLVISYNLIFKNDLNSEGTYFMFTPFFMLLFGVVLVSLGFKVESKKSKKDLEKILKAKIIEM
ncbi:hypothetical protein [Flavobacterium sp. HNIBRBA15423]|uniref:hypothetical protein n=1 Tax=Flavobacterium sp. HNIBRBA15423 TaxID=3458683 RepID=UPI004044E69A